MRRAGEAHERAKRMKGEKEAHERADSQTEQGKGKRDWRDRCEHPPPSEESEDEELGEWAKEACE